MDRQELLLLVIRVSVASALSYITLKLAWKMLNDMSGRGAAKAKMGKECLKAIGFLKDEELDEHELEIAAQLVAPSQLSLSWDNVGGCEELISEIEETLILPLMTKSSSLLLAPPKGVLLYGPPGCGKTLLAKVIASISGACFINLDVSSLTDKWYGETQKLTTAVFSLARKVQPAIIFIDEIDSFLRTRDSFDHEATAMMKAQFMALWDGFSSDDTCQVVVVGATNRPNDVDKAILRRMPCRLHVGYPDVKQRQAVLQVILKNEELGNDVDLEQLAAKIGYANDDANFGGEVSCSDLKEICRLAAVQRARRCSPSLKTAPFCQSDFVKALKKFNKYQIRPLERLSLFVDP